MSAAVRKADARHTIAGDPVTVVALGEQNGYPFIATALCSLDMR